MKEDSRNLVVTVDVSLTEPTDVYQFVYGSQLYGTLFGVFAKFTARKSKEKNVYHVTAFSLKLLNYQGVINIGFESNEAVYKQEKKNERSIEFNVQGTSRILKTKEAKIEPLIEIKQGQPIPITFNRMLYPLPGFDKVRRMPVPGTQRSSKDKLPELSYFDTEFHYRNGEDCYDQILRPGMLGYQDPDPKTNLTLPSGRCHKSDVNLYF